MNPKTYEWTTPVIAPRDTVWHMDARRRLDAVEVGRRIAERRVALGLDQEQLAERAQVSRPYISRLERGIVPNPKLFDIEGVAAALDLALPRLVSPPGPADSDVHVSECATMLAELQGEPPEVVEDVLLMFRTSVSLAKGRRLAQRN